MDPRDLVALAIVAAAAAWLARRAWRTVAGRSTGCHSSESPKTVQIDLPES